MVQGWWKEKRGTKKKITRELIISLEGEMTYDSQEDQIRSRTLGGWRKRQPNQTFLKRRFDTGAEEVARQDR